MSRSQLNVDAVAIEIKVGPAIKEVAAGSGAATLVPPPKAGAGL